MILMDNCAPGDRLLTEEGESAVYVSKLRLGRHLVKTVCDGHCYSVDSLGNVNSGLICYADIVCNEDDL